MHRPSSPLLALTAGLAFVAVALAPARAVPGERTDGQRILGICQTLLGEESSFCDVVTDWSVKKTVDAPIADQPNRQGLAYTIRLIEGQSRYVLGMTSIVSLDGLIPEGTQVRGIVVSLQRAEQPATITDEPLYTTVAGALVGAADPTCGCPYVDSGSELGVTMRDELGNPLPASDDVLIDSLAYGERVVVQLDAVYDLSAGVVLPGDLVRIQACVQYAPADEVDYEGCFDEGGAVRTVRACSGFDFQAYATPKSTKVTLEEKMPLPSHDWILPNGFKARSASELVTPTATLLPVVAGAADPIVFQVTASGEPNTETVISVKGDISCADTVDCDGGVTCSGTVSNTATLDFGDARGRISSTATTNVICAAHRCSPAEVATCDDGDPCTTDGCEIGVGCTHAPYDGPCDDGDACTSGDHCVAGECVAEGGHATCPDDGNPCTEEACDAELGCVRTNLANRSRCEDGNTCTVDDLCMEGQCRSGATISCDDHNPCTTDTCAADGSCAHSPTTAGAGSCEDGNACTVGDHCAAGTCVAGPPPTCQDDGNPCTAETCEAGVGCVSKPKGDNASCSDGNACTQNDVCIGGQCRAGASASCDDRNPCTVDGCDQQLGCYNAPRGGACDDGTACTSASACLNGQCRGTVLVDCNDDNPCTVDSCDAVAGCKHVAVGNGGQCDDGDPCTTGESCQSGTCVPTSLTQCDDGNACTSSICVPGEGCVNVAKSGACEDGDKCTGPDQCTSGVCVAGPALSCDDNNPCTADACSKTAGCSHTAVAGSCDDGDICTGAGTCQAGVCKKGAAVSCDDQNPCTAGQCDAVQGCVQVPVNGACEDNDPCTGTGTCQLGSCVAGAQITCDDGNPCTADYCKPGIGCATLPRSDVPCTDDNPCTTNDRCQNGACVAGTPKNCDDGNPCTVDSCDAGGCQHKAGVGACNDGNPCTVGDVCQAGQCTAGAPKNCNDNDSCTADTCSSSSGACLNTRLENGSVCEDGDTCTGCVWPEPVVKRGFHAADAKPDPAVFPTAVTASLELDQFVGPGAGKAYFVNKADLRWLVLPSGAAVLRGALSLPVSGGTTEEWKVEMTFSFNGVGKAGQVMTPFYEMAAQQGTVYTDTWEYWTLASGAKIDRSLPTADTASLAADPTLRSLPLQVGLRANGRNFGYGASMPVKWTRGTRAGSGVLRLNLTRAQCDKADTCGSAGCGAGSEATECRDILAGDYCTYTDQDFGVACGTNTPGACALATGFEAIKVEGSACGSKAVAFGYGGYRRWGFSTAAKLDAFLPTTGGAATGTLDTCNQSGSSAPPIVGKVFALSLSIALSDVGVLPAPGGVPLGELVRTAGACNGLSLREIARRAEVVVVGAPVGEVKCADQATLEAEVNALLNGFRNCSSVATNVGLPE